jgi:hypothetical protein
MQATATAISKPIDVTQEYTNAGQNARLHAFPAYGLNSTAHLIASHISIAYPHRPLKKVRAPSLLEHNGEAGIYYKTEAKHARPAILMQPFYSQYIYTHAYAIL